MKIRTKFPKKRCCSFASTFSVARYTANPKKFVNVVHEIINLNYLSAREMMGIAESQLYRKVVYLTKSNFAYMGGVNCMYLQG